MKFIENIKNKNQFPIIFIGSGITQRYFKNAPTWEELLRNLWNEVLEDDDYYSKYYQLEEKFGEKDRFNIYTNIATYLEKEFNKAFFDKSVEVKNLTLKDSHDKGISPFKQEIANVFVNLDIKDGMEDEIALFSKMINKARLIVTTNYDDFIENRFKSLNAKIKVNVGNKGLFEKTNDYGELYKIHGSIDNPNSISITDYDYESNESKSSIINAKILSNLTESPIIFFGYSLTDENIRKLLLDFSNNAPFDISEAASRIGVVEYCEGEMGIKEEINALSDLNIHYTNLKTGNYKSIYKEISEIDQGYTPSEIAKYETAFRKIIEVKGQSNQLKTVLADYVN